MKETLAYEMQDVFLNLTLRIKSILKGEWGVLIDGERCMLAVS